MIGLLILLTLSPVQAVDTDWSNIPADDPFTGVGLGSKFVASEWHVGSEGILFQVIWVADYPVVVLADVCNGVVEDVAFSVMYTSHLNYKKDMKGIIMPAVFPLRAARAAHKAVRSTLLEVGYKIRPDKRFEVVHRWDKTSAGQTQTWYLGDASCTIDPLVGGFRICDVTMFAPSTDPCIKGI